MTNTLTIIGAGTSLLEIPPTYTFKNDTMALNVSTIAPQFYDYGKSNFHHSWTYGVFIDNVISNPYYFPEKLYYNASLSNKKGILYLSPQLLNEVKNPWSQPRQLTQNKAEKMVLAPALRTAKELGYNDVILVGCDFCIYDERRYWWEYPEYCDGILTHPLNKTAISAKSMRLGREKQTKNMSGGVRDIAIDSTLLYYIDRKESESTYVNVEDTQRGRAIMNGLLYKQFNKFKSIMSELVDDTFTVRKFMGMGMLELPTVDNYKEL